MKKNWKKNKKEKTTILYDVSPSSKKNVRQEYVIKKMKVYRNMRRQIKFQISFHRSNVEINYFDKATFP